LAFGGFLAGMMLGETEFRHQVESSMRPFRDVLLGLFFVGIGTRFDPTAIPPIWHWVLLGTLLIVLSKTVIVTIMLRATGTDTATSWRTGLMLAVGGEFGLALAAIALDAEVIGMQLGQIAISSVLLAMIVGALLIRFNGLIASKLAGESSGSSTDTPQLLENVQEQQVVIGGYGRVGHTVAALLQASGVPFIAFDLDPDQVKQGRAIGHSVSYGDISDPDLLAAIHVERASLVIITVDHSPTALRTVAILRKNCPHVPVIARARDLNISSQLLEAGAIHAYPEALEASLRLGE